MLLELLDVSFVLDGIAPANKTDEIARDKGKANLMILFILCVSECEQCNNA
jgi:hypothetical protein